MGVSIQLSISTDVAVSDALLPFRPLRIFVKLATSLPIYFHCRAITQESLLFVDREDHFFPQIRTAYRTNQITGFVTVSSKKKKISIIGDQNRNIREFEVVVNFKKAFFFIGLPQKPVSGCHQYFTSINVSKA